MLDAWAVGGAVLTQSQFAREAICAGISSLYAGAVYKSRLITKYYIMSSCAMHFRMPSNNFQSMCCADAVGIARKPPFCLYIVQNSRRYMHVLIHMIQAHTQSFLNPRCACTLIKFRRCVIIMQHFLPFPLVLQKC